MKFVWVPRRNRQILIPEPVTIFTSRKSTILDILEPMIETHNANVEQYKAVHINTEYIRVWKLDP
jgi:hypothetical protein